ncbi:RHS repeat-associated core domain-containing protein [Dyella sp.]|uniref:RHS repeat domain-containing protein n=1 Tax=Dyella sp. TaxID=1869338 RepID=UPI002D79727D|nr:RHS repeat-associated core domain-containing protein [Dyella sp.]HET7332010.1 RHS repeat-associated core domain-containing protein [Dyella sp.]
MNKLLNGLLLWPLLAICKLALAGTVTYVYTDPQGTPLAEADANGNITATFEYMPYGAYVPYSATSPKAGPSGPGYIGHVSDPETGLVYMQARYYDPATGHFLSVDPVAVSEADLFKFNRYDYANNNPILNIDPNGQDPGSPWYLRVWNSIRTFMGSPEGGRMMERIGAGMEAAESGEGNVAADESAELALNDQIESQAMSKSQAPANANPMQRPTTPISSKATTGGAKPAENFAEPTNAPQNAPTKLPPGHSVRVMPPTKQYPNGYWRQTNEKGEYIDPSTGKMPGSVSRSESRARTHVPLPEKQSTQEAPPPPTAPTDD